MNRTARRVCVSVVMAAIAGMGTICSAQDNTEAAVPPMYEYKPARSALSRDEMAFQRGLIQKLLASVNAKTTLSDIETLTGRQLTADVINGDLRDDQRLFSSYFYDFPQGYRIEFDVLKAVAGSLVSSDGFRIILYVPDMRGIDVSECLSLADVNYFARQTGWGQLQAEHPSRIELHGFEMSKDGLRLEALARGNVVDRHFQAVGGSPVGKGLYDEDYITKVYTLQGCVDIPGGNALIIQSDDN